MIHSNATPKPIHSMTPQELADAGIPVEVALRARLRRQTRVSLVHPSSEVRYVASERKGAYRDALAIIEAKR